MQLSRLAIVFAYANPRTDVNFKTTSCQTSQCDVDLEKLAKNENVSSKIETYSEYKDRNKLEIFFFSFRIITNALQIIYECKHIHLLR